MLSHNNNCEKMVAIPPTSSTNQCPQPQNEMIGCSTGRVLPMEKAAGEENQLLLQQQQQQLKCPRCDSSNTKFCYYNNYSLSQPRHFCKACKRYWTRGGTLRNIPVGGSSRSRNHNNNKRFHKTTPSTTFTPHNYISQPPLIQTQTTANSPSKNHLISDPFFSHGGLLSNINNSPNCDDRTVNIPFPRFNHSSSTGGYDLMMNASTTGLGFTSSTDDHTGYRGNGFSSIYGSSSLNCASSNTPVLTMSSLLSSNNLVQHKFINHGLRDGGQLDHGLASLPALEQISNGMMKGEVQVNRSLEWMNYTGGSCGQNQMEHVGLFDPPNSLYWNTASPMGVWSSSADQPNIAPSLTSLI